MIPSASSDSPQRDNGAQVVSCGNRQDPGSQNWQRFATGAGFAKNNAICGLLVGWRRGGTAQQMEQDQRRGGAAPMSAMCVLQQAAACGLDLLLACCPLLTLRLCAGSQRWRLMGFSFWILVSFAQTWFPGPPDQSHSRKPLQLDSVCYLLARLAVCVCVCACEYVCICVCM